jgi:hypothetical protein
MKFYIFQSHPVLISILGLFFVFHLRVLLLMRRKIFKFGKVPIIFLLLGIIVFPISIWRNYVPATSNSKVAASVLIVLLFLLIQNSGLFFMAYREPEAVQQLSYLKGFLLALTFMIPAWELILFGSKSFFKTIK